MTSCSMNRIRDDVFLSLTIFSIWLKYWSMRGCKTTKQEGEIRTGLFLRGESHIYSSQSTGLFSCIARSSSCRGCARLNWQPPGFAFYVSLDLHSEKWHPVKSRGQNGSFQNALSRIWRNKWGHFALINCTDGLFPATRLSARISFPVCSESPPPSTLTACLQGRASLKTACRQAQVTPGGGGGVVRLKPCPAGSRSRRRESQSGRKKSRTSTVGIFWFPY